MRSYSFSSSSSGVFLVVLAVVLGLFATSGSAVPNWDISEVDGDGIDNDGDGYTDSEDTECGSHYEGFGKISVGGQGGTVFWVAPAIGDVSPASDPHSGTHADPCGLRKALDGSNRVIKFTQGGVITLANDLVVKERNVTIDGFTCPSPGVTITQNHSTHGGLAIGSYENLFSHDWIINHIRFDGLWDENQSHTVGWAILSFSATRTNKKVEKVILDHLTIRDDQDKTTLWGHMANFTVSNNLFHSSGKAFLISYYNATPDLIKTDISVHRNVFARNNERNPQLRGWIRNLDIVNNVMFDWDHQYSWGYGTRIKNEPGEESVYANFINNYYEPLNASSRALIYGYDPGPDYADGGPPTKQPQGTVYTGSDMGQLWVAGNILPSGNIDEYSTITGPLPIPAWAQVTTIPAAQAYTFVPQVGMQYKDTRDQDIIDDVMDAIAPDESSIVGRYVLYNNCAFDGNDPAANVADDGAIAPDKSALLAGGTAAFANYTSYARGINGIMVDIDGLPGTPTAGDFTFKIGNDNNPAGWSTGPAPSSITVRAGAGMGGSDRITIIWADNAIQKQWLRVTVLATANTGLWSPDVFYFGNAIGETGNSPSDAEVTPTDEVAVRNNPHTLALDPAAIDDNCDFSRDRKVGPTDSIICRNNGTSGPTALQLISVP